MDDEGVRDVLRLRALSQHIAREDRIARQSPNKDLQECVERIKGPFLDLWAVMRDAHDHVICVDVPCSLRILDVTKANPKTYFGKHEGGVPEAFFSRKSPLQAERRRDVRLTMHDLAIIGMVAAFTCGFFWFVLGLLKGTLSWDEGFSFQSDSSSSAVFMEIRFLNDGWRSC